MSTSSIPETLTEALTGRYAIERELGRGGMATVYLAQDLRHKRRVALKLLDPELGAVVGAERFRREIEMAAELQHPHVLPVFDSGEAGTGVVGSSFSRHSCVKKGGWPPSRETAQAPSAPIDTISHCEPIPSRR